MRLPFAEPEASLGSDQPAVVVQSDVGQLRPGSEESSIQTEDEVQKLASMVGKSHRGELGQYRQELAGDQRLSDLGWNQETPFYPCYGLRVQGLGLRVQGLGFRV